jgi:hypothetical protein
MVSLVAKIVDRILINALPVWFDGSRPPIDVDAAQAAHGGRTEEEFHG